MKSLYSLLVILCLFTASCALVPNEDGELSVKRSGFESVLYDVDPVTGELKVKDSVKAAADAAGAIPYGEIGGAVGLAALGLWQTFRNKSLKRKKAELAASLTKSVDIALSAKDRDEAKREIIKQQRSDGTRDEIKKVLDGPIE